MSTVNADAAMRLFESDEETSIRESVRKICARFGDNYSRECWDAGVPPTEAWNALAEGGFVGINVSEEWGGGGAGMRGLALVTEEMAAAGIPTIMIIVSSGIAGSILEAHGTQEQKERWLTKIADGSMRFSFAITEPDAGTNSHRLRTEVRRTASGYVLNGQKVFISAVEDATAVLVVANFRGDDGEVVGPCLCVIDVDTPGFTRQAIPMPFIGADQQWQLYFDNVHIPADSMIGGEQSGLAAVFDGLNPERIAGGAMACGIARRALEKATAYAKVRVVWNQPIGAHQGVAHPLAKAKIELELARLMTQKAAALYDAGADSTATGEASNIAKYASAEAAIHAVDAAVQTHGGNGLALEYGVSDMWWGARLLRVGPINAEMVLNHIAQHSLGLPKSY